MSELMLNVAIVVTSVAYLGFSLWVILGRGGDEDGD